MIQFGNTFIDKLRPGLKLVGPAFQKTLPDTGFGSAFPNSQPFFRHDQNIVVAHKIGFYSEVAAFVAFDIGVFCITAV